MLNTLKDFLNNLLSRITTTLRSFEDSATFERIMRRYDALPPRRQQNIVTMMKFSFMVMLALIIVGPPFILLSKLHDLRTLEQLEGSATQFQNEFETRLRGFAAPHGWKPLASGSAEALAESFNEYMPSIGIPEDYGSATAAANSLNLSAHEISIRQATHMLFELEGLFPKLQCTSWIVRVNATQPDLVDVEGTFVFNPAFAGQMAESGGEDNGQENFDNSNSGQAPPNGRPLPTHNNMPNNKNAPNNPSSNGNNANLKGEYIPPSPSNPGDFEEFTPPEIPDELPPPPPPGFDEEQPQQ